MNPLEERVKKLEDMVNSLNDEFYLNNFSAHQDFNKTSNFNTRLRVPHYDTLPSTCEVRDVAESDGKLYICSAIDTWTVVGTQS